MTATDIDRLRRGIIEDPADDALRLIYADALEEAGEEGRWLMPLHDFVRRQLAHGEPSMWDNGAWTGPGFVDDAQAGAMDAFRSLVLSLYDCDCEIATVRRGLVESVALPLAAFMRHAKELFGRHPITAVTLTDREFAYAYWVSSGRAVCSGPGYESHGFYIPYQIFRRLKGATTISPGFRGYATAELAHAALSAACVAYGRRKAGLPPLPVHPPADTGRHAR